MASKSVNADSYIYANGGSSNSRTITIKSGISSSSYTISKVKLTASYSAGTSGKLTINGSTISASGTTITLSNAYSYSLPLVWAANGSSTTRWKCTYKIIVTFTYEAKTTKPSAPTSVSLSSVTCAEDQTVTLSWSGAKSGTQNAITGYKIQSSDSDTGVNYSDWQTYIEKVAATATSGETEVSPAEPYTSSDGTTIYPYRRFRVITIGTVSGYKESGATMAPDPLKTVESSEQFVQQPVRLMPRCRPVYIWRRVADPDDEDESEEVSD